MKIPINYKSYFPIVQIIEDNNLIPLEKNKIINSKIKSTLQTIDNTIPKIISSKKSINNIKEISNSGKVFFSVTSKEAEQMIKVEKNIKKIQKEVKEEKK